MNCDWCKQEIGYLMDMDFPVYRFGFILHEHCWNEVKQKYYCVIS
jgi:hypothetical protein